MTFQLLTYNYAKFSTFFIFFSVYFERVRIEPFDIETWNVFCTVFAGNVIDFYSRFYLYWNIISRFDKTLHVSKGCFWHLMLIFGMRDPWPNIPRYFLKSFYILIFDPIMPKFWIFVLNKIERPWKPLVFFGLGYWLFGMRDLWSNNTRRFFPDAWNWKYVRLSLTKK